MNRLATATIGALGAVHAGFDREEYAGVDCFLDLSSEVNETFKVIVRPERVELVMGGLLALGEDIEPEHRICAVLLLVGIAERRSLKIPVSLAVRPLH